MELQWENRRLSTLRRLPDPQNDCFSKNPKVSCKSTYELQESGVLGPETASEKNGVILFQ